MTASDISQAARMPLPLADHSARAQLGAATWAALAAMTAAFVWFFWDFLVTQVRFAIASQADWGHTLAIPFITAYLVYFNRERLARTGLKTTWIGLVPAVVGASGYMLCAAGPPALRHHNLQGACVALTIAGLTLLVCGWRAMRWLWFPLLFLVVFSQTISERLLNIVTYQMQDITARGSAVVLSVFLDVDRLGNTIYIFSNGQSIPLNIAEACSGMRMLMAFLALGAVLAYTGLKHPWQQVLLVVMGVPTAIFVNILRVCTLGVLTLFDSGLAAGDFHSFIGLLWLVPALLIFLGLMWVIRHVMIDDPETSTDSSGAALAAPTLAFDRRAVRAMAIAAIVLVASGVAFRYAIAQLNIYLRKEPVELREPFLTLPSALGNWSAIGKDTEYDEAMLEALGTRDTISRSYAIDGDPRKGLIALHLAYYTGMIDAIPHVPDRCFVAGGLEPRTLSTEYPLPLKTDDWNVDPGESNHATGQRYHRIERRDPFTNQLQWVLMPVGEPRIRVTEFTRKDLPGTNYFGGFFFIANGRTTATPEAIRLMAFQPSERYAYYCKVQLVYAAPKATIDDYLALASDLVADLLPELMLRLPDWREVENRSMDRPVSSSTGQPTKETERRRD